MKVPSPSMYLIMPIYNFTCVDIKHYLPGNRIGPCHLEYEYLFNISTNNTFMGPAIWCQYREEEWGCRRPLYVPFITAVERNEFEDDLYTYPLSQPWRGMRLKTTSMHMLWLGWYTFSNSFRRFSYNVEVQLFMLFMCIWIQLHISYTSRSAASLCQLQGYWVL